MKRSVATGRGLVLPSPNSSCLAKRPKANNTYGYYFFDVNGGTLRWMELNEEPNQIMRWMERIGMYDRTKLDMDAER